MIDQNKIQNAAIDYAFEEGHSSTSIENRVAEKAFANGVKWFKQSIWHDASEKPQGRTAILYQWHDEEGSMDVGIDGIFDDLEWESFVEFNRIDKWCYIEDILPKGGDK